MSLTFMERASRRTTDWSKFIGSHRDKLNTAIKSLQANPVSLKGITSNGQPKDIIMKLAQAGVTGFNAKLTEEVDYLFNLGSAGQAESTNIGHQLSRAFVAAGGTIDFNAPTQDDAFSGNRKPSNALNDILKPNKNNSLASKSPSPAGGAPNMGDLFKDAGKRPA